MSQRQESGYRTTLRSVEREAPRTGRTVLWVGSIAVIVIAILYFAVLPMGILKRDIQRETTQHSQQYVETKVNLLNKLHNDWLQLDAEIIELSEVEENVDLIVAKQAQQKNTLERLRTEADMIPESQVPTAVKLFLSTHSR